LPKYTKDNSGFLPSILSDLDRHLANVNLFVLKLTARVKRALFNVQMAKNSVGRQKRDVRELQKADELEKRATELMTRLESKEG